jgi:flagellar motor switch protein FliN/FliY
MHDSLLSQAEIDALLKGMQQHGDTEDKCAASPVADARSEHPERLERFAGGVPAPAVREEAHPNLGVILDIPLQVAVTLGRVRKTVSEVLKICPGTILELDRPVGDPVDIFLNKKLIARGEVVVMGESFAVRIVHIVGLQERVQMLR